FRRLYGPKAWDESACLKAEDGSGRRSGGASSAVPRVLCLARVVEESLLQLLTESRGPAAQPAK
ncbi:unnamed protein product, partial [Effrenium voratum]